AVAVGIAEGDERAVTAMRGIRTADPEPPKQVGLIRASVHVAGVEDLTRALLDFARLLSLFEKRGVSFVSVTQEFNTSTSLGRLTLHILLSFAQFEREIISERTRDKMSAARRKGRWVGGSPVLGYDVDPEGGRLVINPAEAERVREIFAISAVSQMTADKEARPKFVMNCGSGRDRERL